ncbi:Pentatricopeptide repeat superfamily protein [Dorcoceras hygrometricum]|uniref:Pentatricopeptide repeat superfamily protein n=1 Tax=Dorcoceras hygrometricum TaxID=472368 RepID=A0A2Z7BE59_9LAMI|nr:Pentatricopeptide repeat superfamily protein [Dorcoceras hygrometricum]
MKRRRVEESADGLALMTSSVTSSYSADGLRDQSQESADKIIQVKFLSFPSTVEVLDIESKRIGDADSIGTLFSLDK